MSSKEQYLVTKLIPLLDRCQIDIGHVSPLVAQQPGNSEVGIQIPAFHFRLALDTSQPHRYA